MNEEKIKHQLNCLNYHLSEAKEEKKDAIERVNDIRDEIKELKARIEGK